MKTRKRDGPTSIPAEPLWIRNIQKQLFRMKVPVGPEASQTFVEGATRGYLYAGLTQILRGKKSYLSKRVTKQDALRFTKNINALWRGVIEDLLHVLSHATPQQVEDRLLGFAHGVKCFREEQRNRDEGRPGPIAPTSTYAIYQKLRLNRAKVESCRSIPELYEWLHAELGPAIVGDYERVRKICQRIGLKLNRPVAHKGHRPHPSLSH